MAEVLGLVASGLSVAQIAGSIVITSLKVKTLLDEVKDAPQSLMYMLGHIELLTNILCEETSSDDQGASANPPLLPTTSHLQQALQKARLACQTASEQLEILVGNLISQIDAAHGGVRRKRAMVKVVLKKATLAEYEGRLQKTIQLLTLVQGTYSLALQRAQPEIVVSQLMSALALSPERAHGLTMLSHDKSPTQMHIPDTVAGRPISTRQDAGALHKCWQLGFAKVTGLVRIHTTSRAKDDPINTSTQERVLRIQVQMPAWLCASVLDAVFSRSYAGWNCSLNMYDHIRDGTAEFNLAFNAIYHDDVDGLYRLFQERRCGPHDFFVRSNGSEESLLTCALDIGAWKVSGYLLNYGAAQPNSSLFRLGLLRPDSESIESYIEALLKNELNDSVRMSCLISYWNDLDSFTNIVNRLWPYNEFYTAALDGQQLILAMDMLSSLDTKWYSPSPAVFQYLFESSSLVQAGSNITTTKILSCITWGLGNIVWYDPDVASKWYNAIRDVALRLDKSVFMPEQQLLGYGLIGFPNYHFFATATPFTDLFRSSTFTAPGHRNDTKCGRQHKIGSRVAHCDKALQMWLNILQECGIDLLEYGRQERQRLTDERRSYKFEIWRDVWHDDSYWNTENGRFRIRLISFEYGRQPEDWKLWWSEPTDTLVGNFWKKMDPEPLRIPGSWDEDF